MAKELKSEIRIEYPLSEAKEAVQDYLDQMTGGKVQYAKRNVAEAGLTEQFSFKEGDVNELPFDDNVFDWAWSMDCVGYLPLDPAPMLQELARVVRPGGRVAILAWSSEQLLPGYPQLEGRLKATSMGIAPFVKGMKPALHFLCAPGLVSRSRLRGSNQPDLRW